MLELRNQLAQKNSTILPNSNNLPASVLEKEILPISSLLLQQERIREISDSLGQQLQKQTDVCPDTGRSIAPFVNLI